jgi:hypothetical protein
MGIAELIIGPAVGRSGWLRPSYALSLPESLHHKVLVVCNVADADNARIETVDFKPVALVGLDRVRCGHQDGKMHLIDMRFGQGEKVLDQTISETFASTAFLDIHRVNVATVL